MDRKKVRGTLTALGTRAQAYGKQAEKHLLHLEDGVVDLYQKLEDGVYIAYKTLENGALRATDVVMDALLGKEDENDKTIK